MTWLENLILSVVEGLTEFLPVSSTGHLMLTREWLGMGPNEHETYLIAIQFGAIASVLTLYWRKFFGPSAIKLYPILFIGFIPAAILGLNYLDNFWDCIVVHRKAFPRRRQRNRGPKTH